MIDPRFYGSPKAYTAKELIADLMAFCQAQSKETLPPILIEGDETHLFKGIGTLKDATNDQVTYFHKSSLKNVDYRDALKNTKAGGVFVTQETAHLVPSSALRLIVLRPYRAFAAALKLFYPEPIHKATVHPTAVIHESAKIGKDCTIGAYTVIEEGAEIGDHTVIEAHTFIAQHVTIGAHCSIQSHVSLSYAILHDHVRIKPGARIGQRGFGFEMDEKGPIDMPQMGRVIIENGVEIGANTCIDRGSQGDTIIGKNSRIDNLVQMAHNVKVGSHCILVAQVGIAGSTTLGHGVVAAGQAGFSGHLNIGDGARIAAQSGVMRDIPPQTDVAGSPSLPARDWHKQNITLRRMIEKK